MIHIHFLSKFHQKVTRLCGASQLVSITLITIAFFSCTLPRLLTGNKMQYCNTLECVVAIHPSPVHGFFTARTCEGGMMRASLARFEVKRHITLRKNSGFPPDGFRTTDFDGR